MSANIEALVREGIAAFKAGQKEAARTHLMKAVELDQYNEQAWLWLSAAVDAIEDQRTCLENVLAINPANERARAALNYLTQKMAARQGGGSASNGNADAPTGAQWSPSDAPAAAPAPSQPAPAAPQDTGDNWLADLPASDLAAASQAFSASPFTSTVDAPDDNPFASGPFSTDVDSLFTAPEPAPAPAPTRPAPPVSPPAPARAPAPAVPSAPPRAAAAPLVSPGRETTAVFDAPPAGNSLFAEFEIDELADEDLAELDADTLFSYIPPEIKATRLPGTRERLPRLMIVSLVLLILMNVGAAVALYLKLAG